MKNLYYRIIVVYLFQYIIGQMTHQKQLNQNAQAIDADDRL